MPQPTASGNAHNVSNGPNQVTASFIPLLACDAEEPDGDAPMRSRLRARLMLNHARSPNSA
jgi:hypothetical protein